MTAEATPSTELRTSLTVREAYRTRAFWILVTIFGLHGLALSGTMVHQLPLLQSLGFNSREGANIIGLIFVLSGIGRLSAEFRRMLTDRSGRSRERHPWKPFIPSEFIPPTR